VSVAKVTVELDEDVLAFLHDNSEFYAALAVNMALRAPNMKAGKKVVDHFVMWKRVQSALGKAR
jgi:hypothetical protein